MRLSPHTSQDGHHQNFINNKCWTVGGGNVNIYSHYGEQYGDSLKKIGINLPYDPGIPLLGIYPEKATILKDTCAPVFIAALFTIARTQKQPRCPSIDEWIKKFSYVYIYTHTYIYIHM